jgi:ornithine--oxo-acid transaminase
MTSKDHIELCERHGAHNYHPLPVVIARGEGVWVWDVEGNRYLDMLASYSALNQGHRHPAILEALREQCGRVTLTSRAFYNDQIGPFFQELAELVGLGRVLPMNSGAEAVETAIKAARKWGYTRKGVAAGSAEIIACANNFHGRTTTIVSFSTEEQYREGFGPFTPGFKLVDYGDARALERAITPATVAFLVEPIQGEAGILIPPPGFLREAREITRRHGVLLVLDEIQTGFGRTGKMFCYQHEGVEPDLVILGKALGGGVLPVSAVVARDEVMDVFRPGDHGSTFGGNPLACAVGRAAMRVLREERLAERSAELGAHFIERLRAIRSPHVKEVRGRGLFIGVEVHESSGTARPFCEKLMAEGILSKETHQQVIRFAPPLVIRRDEIDWALARIEKVLTLPTL